jgi:hypothetical protein
MLQLYELLKYLSEMFVVFFFLLSLSLFFFPVAECLKLLRIYISHKKKREREKFKDHR